jgi:hypothetical protein
VCGEAYQVLCEHNADVGLAGAGEAVIQNSKLQGAARLHELLALLLVASPYEPLVGS